MSNLTIKTLEVILSRDGLSGIPAGLYDTCVVEALATAFPGVNIEITWVKVGAQIINPRFAESDHGYSDEFWTARDSAIEEVGGLLEEAFDEACDRHVEEVESQEEEDNFFYDDQPEPHEARLLYA